MVIPLNGHSIILLISGTGQAKDLIKSRTAEGTDMANSTLPKQAQVVIIGGGSIG